MQLESRGLEVWESERAAVEDATLCIPDYYVFGGQGPLHSYDGGNCNWPAAFDAKPAFELVPIPLSLSLFFALCLSLLLCLYLCLSNSSL